MFLSFSKFSFSFLIFRFSLAFLLCAVCHTSANSFPWLPLSHNQGQVLEYEISHTYHGKQFLTKAHILVEPVYVHTGTKSWKRKKEKQYTEAFRMHTSYTIKRYQYPRSTQSEVFVKRTSKLPLLWQYVQIHDWNTSIWRTLSWNTSGSEFHFYSPGRGEQIYPYDKHPLSLEHLFVYLRNMPLKEGYKESIWLLPSLLTEHTKYKVDYAEVAVKGKTKMLDQHVWHIEVSRESGEKMDFYLSNSFMRIILLAKVSSDKTWHFRSIQHKRFWPF